MSSIHKTLMARAREARAAVLGRDAAWCAPGSDAYSDLTGVTWGGVEERTEPDDVSGGFVKKRVLIVEALVGSGTGRIPSPVKNGLVRVDADGNGAANWVVDEVLYNDGDKCRLSCVRPIQQDVRGRIQK